MKYVIIVIVLLGCMNSSKATDPIKPKSYFIQVDVSYSFHHHYNQAQFAKKGLAFGGAVSMGHRAIPIYFEYTYQLPLIFRYRNNEIRDQFQEIGLRYNLNHSTYLIPNGLDPYIGAGLMLRSNEFTQYDISGNNNAQVLNNSRSNSTTYKLSAGIRLGSDNLILGLHYDFLPKGLDISNSEGQTFQIYNSMHIFSARLGIRLNQVPGRKVKCPRLNKRQKRTLAF